MRREAHFRFDVRQALAEGKVPPAEGNAIYATVFSKGSRISVEEAKDYLHAKVEEGILPPPTRDRIAQLVDIYGCWR